MAEIHHHVATPRTCEVRLSGSLSRFGTTFKVMAATPVGAVSAVCALCEGLSGALRRGRYFLVDESSPEKPTLSGAALARPLACDRLLLVPELSGGSRGRGKALIGLTLLGLSFVPGANQAVSGGFTSFGQSVGGAETAAAFGRFGSQLLGRSGALLMLAGAAEMTSPQHHVNTGTLRSSSLSPPAAAGQGAAIPLVYGQAVVHHPTVISSGLSIEH